MSARSERGAFTAAARRAGSARSGALDGVDLALADIAGLKDAMAGDGMRELIEEQTAIMHEDARGRALRFRRTGRYLEAIKKKIFHNTDGSLVGTVFVIQGLWQRAVDAGKNTLWPRALPIWLEWGTRRMDPKPHLLPAFNAAKERLNRAVEALLRRRAES